MTGRLNWWQGGLALGLMFAAAVALMKPIGVSTQFVVLDGMAWNAVAPGVVTPDDTAKAGYTSTNAYLAKSGGKIAAEVANPLSYGFLFVLFMIPGALLSWLLKGAGPTKEDRSAPEVWRNRFGGAGWPRYLAAFAGGFLVLVGARLAGGCTSGHMMSGIMQTAVSGYLFAAAAFAVAVPVAIVVYTRK